MKKSTLAFLLLFTFFGTLGYAQTWSIVGGELNSHITALYPFEGKLFVGGNFTNIDGDAAYGLAEWDGDAYSNRNTTLIGGLGIDNFSTYQGMLMAVGAFYDGIYGPGFVAVWDGTALVGDQYRLNGNVYDLLAVDESFYVVGYFDEFEGTDYNHVAKFNGAYYETVGDGFEFPIGDLCMYNDQIIAGGGNGDALTYLSGTDWIDLGTGGPAGASMAVFQGELYAIGCFDDAVDGTARYIAKWDGSTWSDVGGGLTGGFNCARAIVATNDYLYVGGQFTGAGGVDVQNIAKWDGSSWSAVGDGIPDQIINSLAVYDGYLYAGPMAVDFTNHLWKFSEVVSDVKDEEAAAKPAIQAYPNPANEWMTISQNGIPSGSIDIQITDLSGRVVYTSTLTGITQQISVDDLAEGVYTIRYSQSNGAAGSLAFVVVH